MPRLAVNPDVSLTLLDDAIHGGQSKSCTLPPLFGCEERLKDARLGLSVHSCAGVAHRQHDVLARCDICVLSGVKIAQVGISCFNRELSAPWHGVTGVCRKIYDDLFHLTWVSLDTTQRRVEPDRQLNVFSDES